MAKFTIPDVIPASLGGGRRVEDVMTEWIDTSARTVARVGSKYGIMGFHKVQQLRGKEKEIVEEEGAAAVREGMRGMPNLGIRSKIAESVSGVSVRTVMDAVAAVVTDEFLEFSAQRGNDLRQSGTIIGGSGSGSVFPGLKGGCKWWLEAFQARGTYGDSIVPQVMLESTHQAALKTISIEDLQKFSFKDGDKAKSEL
ncbi:hypothetical protein EMMF5_005492 [Cystobasidiomycetes sp. EMM_F5]